MRSEVVGHTSHKLRVVHKVEVLIQRGYGVPHIAVGGVDPLNLKCLQKRGWLRRTPACALAWAFAR